MLYTFNVEKYEKNRNYKIHTQSSYKVQFTNKRMALFSEANGLSN